MSEQTPAPSERAPSATRTLCVAKQVALQIYRTPLPVMAAALAYRTIFGLIPVFVIGLVVLGAFATKDHVTQVVRDLLRYAGLTEIVIEPEPETTNFGAVGAGFLPIAPTEGGAAAGEEAKGAAARLDAWVEQLVLNVREVKLVAIGLTGLAMLAYAALSFVVEIERAFNRIYHAPTGRSWPRRVTQYWTMLTLGSVFLVASFYVGGSFPGWVAWIDGGGDRSALVPIAGFAVTVVISTGLLLFLYVTVPNTRVSVKTALAGAVLAALLWEGGKWGFTAFLQWSKNYARLYGAVALIPLFMLWVYVTWVIVLLGLQVSYILQTFRHGVLARVDSLDRPPVVDGATVIALAAHVAARFQGGRPVAPDEAARSLGLDPALAERLLEAMADEGLLHRVPAGRDEVRFALARPPESVRATEVMAVGVGASSGRADRADSADLSTLGKLRRREAEAFAGMTLADLVGRSGGTAIDPETAGQASASAPEPA